MCLAIPGQLLSLSDGDDASAGTLFRRGRVAFGAVVKEVSLACLPQAQVGDYVLVHAGIALSIVDEAEARRVFELLEQLEGTTT